MKRDRLLRRLLVALVLFLIAMTSVLAQGLQLPPAGNRALVRFAGEIKSRPSDSPLGTWVVGDKTITVVEATMIDETRGGATVGAQVQVIARSLPATDTRSVALEAILIRVLEAGRLARVFVVRGIVLETQPGFFAVNGMRILYDTSTPGAGDLQEGVMVIVWATRTSEGIRALRIRAEANPLPIVEFEGVIRRLSRELWIVDGRRVRVTASTVIDGTPAPGAIARVRGYAQRNGVVLALVITIIEQPQVVEWTGRIERIPPTITIYPPVYTGRWVVGGREVWATPETIVTGTPRIGLLAHVVARPESGRLLKAIKIQVLTAVD